MQGAKFNLTAHPKAVHFGAAVSQGSCNPMIAKLYVPHVEVADNIWLTVIFSVTTHTHTPSLCPLHLV